MNTTPTSPPSDISAESVFAQSSSANASELILIGVLSYFSITSTIWTLDYILKDLFIYFNMIPMVNFWIREILYFGLFVISYFLILKKIGEKNIRKKQIKKYSFWLIGFLMATQVFQMIYGFYQFDIIPDPYKTHLRYYIEEIGNNQFTVGLVGPISTYVKYLFIIILVMHFNKKTSDVSIAK